MRERVAREGGSPTFHVFAYAPLPLTLFLGMLLDRGRVVAYQNDRNSGSWTPLVDTAEPADSGERFFDLFGLPEAPVPGPGLVSLSVSVTQDIRAKAAARFAELGTPVLADVALVARRGVGQQAFGGGAEGIAAARELQALLDALHRLAPDAARVCLATATPGSLALVLGRAVNPKAQHALSLFNLRNTQESYVEVHTIEAGRTAGVPVAPKPAERLLFFAASPDHPALARLAFDREFHGLQEELERSADGQGIELRVVLAGGRADLQRALFRDSPTFLHFSGHGVADGALVLDDGQGGVARVSAEAVAELLRIYTERGRRIRCVVLNACYSEPLARALAVHVDCVVGMRGRIDDEAAVAFAASFYLGLGAGQDTETAFALACNRIGMERLPGANQPQLYRR